MQINNTTSPNFKALMIAQEAKPALRQCSKEQLKKIQLAGEELKNTKFYNVKIDKDLKCSLEIMKNKFKDFFFGVFEPKVYFNDVREGNSKNILMFDGLFGVAHHPVTDLTSNETRPTFNMWGFGGAQLGIADIEGISKIAKELDLESEMRHNEKLVKMEEARRAQLEIDAQVDDLLSEFSV